MVDRLNKLDREMVDQVLRKPLRKNGNKLNKTVSSPVMGPRILEKVPLAKVLSSAAKQTGDMESDNSRGLDSLSRQMLFSLVFSSNREWQTFWLICRDTSLEIEVIKLVRPRTTDNVEKGNLKKHTTEGTRFQRFH